MLSSFAAAQVGAPHPTGPSIRVDSMPTANRGLDVAWRCFEDVTMVVWGSYGSVGNDADGSSIQGRFFLGREPHGPQLQINVFTDGDQLIPEVTVDSSGNFIVGWYSDDRTLRRRVFDCSSLTPGAETEAPWPAFYYGTGPTSQLRAQIRRG